VRNYLFYRCGGVRNVDFVDICICTDFTTKPTGILRADLTHKCQVPRVNGTLTGTSVAVQILDTGYGDFGRDATIQKTAKEAGPLSDGIGVLFVTIKERYGRAQAPALTTTCAFACSCHHRLALGLFRQSLHIPLVENHFLAGAIPTVEARQNFAESAWKARKRSTTLTIHAVPIDCIQGPWSILRVAVVVG